MSKMIAEYESRKGSARQAFDAGRCTHSRHDPGTGRDDCTRVQDVIELSSIQVRPATNRQKLPLRGSPRGKDGLDSSHRTQSGAAVRQFIAKSFQTYRYPAHCRRHFSADLWAAELQDHAIGILQLNASSPSRNGPAGSDRAVSAFNRSRPCQIKGPSDELRCRSTDRKSDAHARYGEWIALASQDQHALAAADSDDEPAFREYDGDLTGFGPRWRAETSHAYEQGNQGRV